MTELSGLMDVPRAHGGAAGSAQLRRVPEDFVVREWLGFEADGEGDHLLLKVRKRGANTMWVAKQLARLGNIHPRDVGFAGLKDRNALTEQSYTVPLRSAIGSEWIGVSGEGFEVIDAQRQRRKLKRGALKGNDFQIVLRDFQGDTEVLEQRLRSIAAAGVPNYFGPQRFGRGGGNLKCALAWFRGEGPAPQQVDRGFALSAARSAIFNAILAERVAAGSWNRLLPGEVVNLDGSGSVFIPPELDAVLHERCERMDVHPTAPLWCADAQDSSGEVAALEQAVVARHAELAAGLEGQRLESMRRALRLPVRNLQWQIEGNDVHLQFRLHRGSFATAVLHELLGNAFELEEAED